MFTITADAGNCLLQLEQAERATGLLEEGVALFSKSLARDRQNYLIHLADALARPGKQCDLDAAAGRGMAAIDLAEGLDSTRSINLIRNLHTQLKPHAKIPTVRDFVERAQGLLAAKATRWASSVRRVVVGCGDPQQGALHNIVMHRGVRGAVEQHRLAQPDQRHDLPPRGVPVGHDVG